MNTKEKQLWEKLRQFHPDEPGTEFPFSERLARENGWSKLFSLRVIEEYKKFIFLCCISGQGVTPSDPVDQVWHLHLTFTRSYWTDLCKNILEREIHHNPTKGGKAEGRKFHSYYSETLELYRQKFRTEPPEDIWQDHKTRFGEINFQRVNRDRFWLIRKPARNLKIAIASLSLAILTLSFVAAKGSLIWVIIALALIFSVGLLSNIGRKGGRGKGGSGCSPAGCGGCSSKDSGHSGCSGSGCSGCGN